MCLNYHGPAEIDFLEGIYCEIVRCRKCKFSFQKYVLTESKLSEQMEMDSGAAAYSFSIAKSTLLLSFLSPSVRLGAMNLDDPYPFPISRAGLTPLMTR
jgi:hypothetical protein